ncbi:hypothetical protein [Streptomyces sp. NPDC000983]|uniref:hypothetical protein n=1 Tax=Streptomyces sp. NPDC000983 TaxID=3154373 RepID=UPI00331B8EA3
MGRVGVRLPRVQFSTRMTWTFSARAGMGRPRPARARRAGAVSAAGRVASAALLRSVLRGTRARRLPVTPPPPRLRGLRRLPVRRGRGTA